MNERRSADQRIDELVAQHAELHACVGKLSVAVSELRATTDEVRDILASFRVIGRIAKWIGAIAAAGAAIIAFWRQLKG